MKKSRRMLLTALSMILMLALLLPGCATIPKETIPVRENIYDIHYVEDDPSKYYAVADTTHGDLEEELRAEQLCQLLPKQLPDEISASGYTTYTNLENTDELEKAVYMRLKTGAPDIIIQFKAVTAGFVTDKGIWNTERVSVFNGVPFRVFELSLTKETTGLWAMTQKENFFFIFLAQVPNEKIEQAKCLFEEILAIFTYEEKLEVANWASIQPRYSGEYFYRWLTLEEAQKDDRFGHLAPKEGPEAYDWDWGYRDSAFHGDYLQLQWRHWDETAVIKEKTVTWGCEPYDPEWNSTAMNDPAGYTDRETGNVIYEIERLIQPCQHGYLDHIASHGILLFGVKKEEDLIWITSAGNAQWVKEQLYEICGVELPDPWECESWNGPEEEYYQDAEFGKYLPKWQAWMHSPAFLRHQSETENCLAGQYTVLETDGYIDWHISYADDSVAERLADIEAEETYSLSGYSNPWDHRIPEMDRETVRCPVFLAEEVTLETVNSRVYHTVEEQDITRMQFDVLYGDVIVSIHAVGAAPERVYELIDMVRTGVDG